MATLAKTKPEASPEQVQRFERRLREVKLAVANLPGDDYHAELIKIIRRGGWKIQRSQKTLADAKRRAAFASLSDSSYN